ncbi:AAA family ATPase [Agrobacterium larrymoorei]|nr:AAA family ATPase [Agrobacterium larrymoorei]
MNVDVEESDYGDDDFTEADLDSLESASLTKAHASLVKTVTDKVTRNHATFSRDDLEQALMNEMDIVDREKRAELVEIVVGHTDVVGLRETADAPVTRYTTFAVLTEEQQLLDNADALSSASHHRLGIDRRAALLQKHDLLNEEQRRAVAHLTDREGFAVLKGEAGTGKTKVLSVVREGYEGAGRRVLALSFTNDVVQDLRQNAGFGHANTVDGELGSLKKGTANWKDKPVIVVDEAAMLSTTHLSAVLHEARKAGAKVIATGDDHQLSSIRRGGMFGSLAEFHGAAELHEVQRVPDIRQKQAFNHMHKGEFEEALTIFDEQKAIHWCKTSDQARRELVETWKRDSAAAPEKTRLVFAYTNADVKELNSELRNVVRQQGRLGQDHILKNVDGPFAVGDRLQFTATDKSLGLYNGRNATLRSIEGTVLAVREDGATDDKVFDTAAFNSFRHGYAGTIHRGQGKTFDQTYLFHSDQWRANASYVALTRHRDRTALFVKTNVHQEHERVSSLARKIGRIDDRRPASSFYVDADAGLVKRMSDLKLRDGLFGQIAGQKREIADLEEGVGRSAFGRDRSAPTVDGPDRPIKRLKSYHGGSPRIDAVARRSTGQALQFNGDNLKGNAVSATDAGINLSASVTGQIPRRNLNSRSRGRNSYGRE